MPATAPSRGAPRMGYQPDRPALVDRHLDRAVRESMRQLRATCTRTLDTRSSQAFSDAQRGRALGTVCLAKMLDGAERAGAPLEAALNVVRVLDAFVRATWGRQRVESFPLIDLVESPVVQ